MIIKNKETLGFQSEVKQLLHLMVHSLYSSKEIFLRELISNASDAADKLRFHALSQPNLYEGDVDLRVRLSFNKEKRIIIVSDNGIGMRREEVIDNLGTIAKSGTKAFIESIGLNKLKDTKLIGQFGVGFYSVFIVADKVTVYTRAAGVDINEGVLWESAGKGDYTIANTVKSNRGTEITLHLRDGEDEFLEDWRIKDIIKKYSDHIMLPVEIEVRQKKDKKKDNDINGITWERVNKAQALWTRNKTSISDKEYIEFYKYLSSDFNDPLTWSHNHVEGKQEYTSLIYIPTKAPWDMWNREHKHGLKLYVQRVFIMDDAKQFMPNYLRFVKGLINFNDLPLNISREMLQDSRIVQNLKGVLTKRVLSMLEKLAKDNSKKYQSFWETFGLVLKEGPGEDPDNIEVISRLLRFASTKSNNSVQNVSLEEYVSRMLEKQKKIYYITADSYAAAKSSPHLELLKKKNIEVMLLFDRIDEWMMRHLSEFNGKTFQAVNKADSLPEAIIGEKYKNQKEIKDELNFFIEQVKTYLGKRVKEVRFTYRLTDTPAVVTTEDSSMTTQMAKLFTATGQTVPEIKYIFELNPEHSIVKYISKINDQNLFNDWIELLLDQALLAECGTLEDPNQFIRRINKLLNINILK